MVGRETRRQCRPRQTSSTRAAQTWLAKHRRVGISDGKADDLGAAQSKAYETVGCLITSSERYFANSITAGGIPHVLFRCAVELRREDIYSSQQENARNSGGNM